MERYAQIARQHDLVLLGNLDRSIDATYRNRTLARWGASSVAQLGDRAVLLTDDDELAATARALVGDQPWQVDSPLARAALLALESMQLPALRHVQADDLAQLDRVLAANGWDRQPCLPEASPHQPPAYRRRRRGFHGVPVEVERAALGYLTGVFEALWPDPWDPANDWVLPPLTADGQRATVDVWNDLRRYGGVFTSTHIDRAVVAEAFRVIRDKAEALRRLAHN